MEHDSRGALWRGSLPNPHSQLGAASGHWRYQQQDNESGFVSSQ